ncbi:MAG: hypothetical protein KY475_16715 [Planctomycetes bacterium]|nr:hypothetical protein [Planctomycetota bacterium]
MIACGSAAHEVHKTAQARESLSSCRAAHRLYDEVKNQCQSRRYAVFAGDDGTLLFATTSSSGLVPVASVVGGKVYPFAK